MELCNFQQGQRQVIKDFAATQRKSLNRFILDAVEAQMQKEKLPDAPD